MNFRKALSNHIFSIVKSNATDELGIQKEHFAYPLPLEYLNAFERTNIEAHKGQKVA